ncbi:MAG TPA: type II toxin-antitoxin system PemK/MazF family toxin [Terriglobia bacterium]|nr:type II toxin-antitoxin system PemK/MazF family toxin [Terriglobia bacterium]
MAGAIARGDIRLYRFPGPDKERPVLVLTRKSAIPYLSSTTVAPITSTIRDVPSEVRLGEMDGMKGPAPSISTTLSPNQKLAWVAALSDERMSEVCAALGFALGCIS